MTTINGIKVQSASPNNQNLINASLKIKETPPVITIDDDDDDMGTNQSHVEPKSVISKPSSFEAEIYSVDVKPLHHELQIEDITEEEIGSQSSIQCQLNCQTTESIDEQKGHEDLVNNEEKRTDEVSSEMRISNTIDHSKDCNEKHKLDPLSEQELQICQFLLRHSEPIMGELRHIIQINNTFQIKFKE